MLRWSDQLMPTSVWFFLKSHDIIQCRDNPIIFYKNNWQTYFTVPLPFSWVFISLLKYRGIGLNANYEYQKVCKLSDGQNHYRISAVRTHRQLTCGETLYGRSGLRTWVTIYYIQVYFFTLFLLTIYFSIIVIIFTYLYSIILICVVFLSMDNQIVFT